MNILTRGELTKMLDNREDFLLLNVLSAASFHKAHIPGSHNIPLSEPGFLQKVADMAGIEGHNRRIVTYCGGFHCTASKDAANHLLAADYTKVSAFEGGMEDWLNAGYAVEGETAKSCDEPCSS